MIVIQKCNLIISKHLSLKSKSVYMAINRTWSIYKISGKNKLHSKSCLLDILFSNGFFINSNEILKLYLLVSFPAADTAYRMRGYLAHSF